MPENFRAVIIYVTASPTRSPSHCTRHLPLNAAMISATASQLKSRLSRVMLLILMWNRTMEQTRTRLTRPVVRYLELSHPAPQRRSPRACQRRSPRSRAGNGTAHSDCTQMSVFHMERAQSDGASSIQPPSCIFPHSVGLSRLFCCYNHSPDHSISIHSLNYHPRH